MSPHRWYIQPHVVRIIRPKWGECLLCGKTKDEMIWVKDLGLVCPDHDAYAVVCEYDDGSHARQTVVKILPTEGEARRESEELNRRMVEGRTATGFIPASYTAMPLRGLVWRRERTVELDEPLEDAG
jgi:hypothetical protein